MPRLRGISWVALFVASTSTLPAPSAASAFMYAGIAARIEAGTHDGLPRQHPRDVRAKHHHIIAVHTHEALVDERSQTPLFSVGSTEHAISSRSIAVQRG